MAKLQIAFTRRTIARAASLAVVSSATALLLTACLFSDDSTPATTGDTGGTGTGGTGQSISGAVVKGPVSGSTVTVYVLNADGSLGAALGSATTSNTGADTISSR